MARDPRTFKLGGRAYRAVAVSTVERDVFVMGRVRTAGLDSISIENGESAEHYATRVLETLLSFAGVLELIGALIIPDELADDQWTPDVARETARLVGRITDEEQKGYVKQALLGLLVPFLESGLGCWTATSRSSESQSEGPPDGSLEAASSTGSGRR